MSLAALEFNDQSLLIQAEDGPMHAEAGVSRITASGIESGESALEVAWLEPQNSFNQYWCHLNQTPLASKQKWARHHGDIAFAQLKSLWQQGGNPDELMLLVPGSFSDEQLSLLLGMVSALPAQTMAVLDSALAACLEVTTDTLFVDVQLHQTVLTVCSPNGSSIAVSDQEVFPGLGVMQVHNSIARHVSHLLIDSFRYDPLDTSSNEQAIYDRIPGWLNRLCWEDEVSETLQSSKGELPYILNKRAVRSIISDRLENVRSFASRFQHCDTLLSHSSGFLSGLSDIFADARVAAHSAATDHCLEHSRPIVQQLDGIYRVQELQRPETAEAPAPRRANLATHLLFKDTALPLNRPISFLLNDTVLDVRGEYDANAPLSVVLRDESIQVVNGVIDIDAELPSVCEPGQVLRVADQEFKLIEVRNG